MCVDIYFMLEPAKSWGGVGGGLTYTFQGVVEVEVYPSNFSWRRHGRGSLEGRYSIYFVGPLQRFEGVVEVYLNNFSWRRRGRGVVEVG